MLRRVRENQKSPFSPSFGVSPSEVLGRQDILDQLAFAIDNPRSPYTKTLITGVRGGGKTVTLNTFANEARQENDLIVFTMTATGKDSLPNEMLTQIGEYYQAWQKFRLKGFSVDSKLLKFQFEKQELTLSFAHAVQRFMDDFDVKTQKKLIISIDEAQADLSGLRRIGTAFQQWQSLGYQVLLVVAGLPVLTIEVGEDQALSFFSRSAQYQMTSLPLESVAKMYQKELAISAELARKMAEKTKGYPYMVQLLGAGMWDSEQRDSTKLQELAEDAKNALYTRVFDLIDRDLSDFDRSMLEVIVKQARIFRPKDLVVEMSVSNSQVGQYLRKLEKIGLIERVKRGEYQLVLPFFDEYVKERY